MHDEHVPCPHRHRNRLCLIDAHSQLNASAFHLGGETTELAASVTRRDDPKASILHVRVVEGGEAADGCGGLEVTIPIVLVRTDQLGSDAR